VPGREGRPFPDLEGGFTMKLFHHGSVSVHSAERRQQECFCDEAGLAFCTSAAKQQLASCLVKLRARRVVPGQQDAGS
jgi:hypothetical protein